MSWMSMFYRKNQENESIPIPRCAGYDRATAGDMYVEAAAHGPTYLVGRGFIGRYQYGMRRQQLRHA